MLASFCALGFTLPANMAQAAPYRIVSEDKIMLRVVEWSSTEAKYQAWEAVNGEYTVDGSGNTAIPLVGEVKAQGLTTTELSAAISDALSRNGGSSMRPFISIEITEHAPIYVVGTVKTPGKFPFDADLTVMKAVSLAGGIENRGDNMFLNYERDRIQAAGAVRTASIDQSGLLLRAARLRAEIAGRDSFDLPDEIKTSPTAEAQLADERNLMRLRRVELESQIRAANDLKELYTQEIATLQAKIVTQNRQIELANNLMKAGESLASKGLSINSRQYELERSLADVKSGLLDLEIALTKSRQSLAENSREITTITNTRNAESQRELNEVELALRKAQLDMQVAQLLANQAGIQAQQLQLEERDVREMQPEFEVVRRNADGTYTTLTAQETTELQPHDLVKIKFGFGPNGVGTSSGSAMRDGPRLSQTEGAPRTASDGF
ncbi:polysaccharide biosynthesis/export family protein [Aureimonas psammosilenae]|uniref:polysaccharide biosynthesis/export family protein n=1 Tax=Aureimonas psammosilenae TaxID=2495496 RepID=UPI00186A44F8|nr:polysaccharide biosynthesis/export family protein [Aureimonas psammosilenae]